MAIAKAKLEKIVTKHFAGAVGPFHSLVVRRGGTAAQREVVVNQKIRLAWLPGGSSVPIDVPAGSVTLHFFVRGKAGATWGFVLTSPHSEALGGDKLEASGVEAFDTEVAIP